VRNCNKFASIFPLDSALCLRLGSNKIQPPVISLLELMRCADATNYAN
jgi:hypothetical protein